MKCARNIPGPEKVEKDYMPVSEMRKTIEKPRHLLFEGPNTVFGKFKTGAAYFTILFYLSIYLYHSRVLFLLKTQN